MPPLTHAEIRALVSFLDDREPGVAKSCRERLFAEGEPALRVLREVAKSGDVLPGKKVAIQALQQLEDHLVDGELLRFAVAPPAELDLESGAILIARTQNAGLVPATIHARLDVLADEVLQRLQGHESPREQADGFVDVLHARHGFTGNRSDYFDPENSFLDQVLRRRTGIPISLSTVYLLIARRIGVPMFGIGMPGRFVLRCGESDGEPTGGAFLDPFDGGRSMSREECEAHLRRTGFSPNDAMLEPLPDRFILARMIANLIHVYRRREDVQQVARFHRLFERVRGEATLA